MKPNRTSVKNRIPERASAYVNMKTVLGRVEKRGQLEAFLKLITEAKSLEEDELHCELSEDQKNVTKYSQIFKDNFKTLLGIIGNCFLFSGYLLVDEVWSENATAENAAPTREKDTHPKAQTINEAEMEQQIRDCSKETDHAKPYSLSPEDRSNSKNV